MAMMLGFVGFLGAIISLVGFIVRFLFKKGPSFKKWLTSLACCVVVFFAAVALSPSPAPKSSNVNQAENDVVFTPVYVKGEIQDTSIPAARRFTMRITLPDGLDKEDVRKNVVQAAEELMKEKDAKAVTVWAHWESDQIKQGYSAAMCTIAPFGDIGKAVDPNTSQKDMQAVVTFNDFYFSDSEGKPAIETITIVERVSEKTRREIFKAAIAAERKETDMFEKSLADVLKKRGHSTATPGDIAAATQAIGNVKEAEDGKIMKQYKLTEQEYEDICLEGAMKYWAQE